MNPDAAVLLDGAVAGWVSKQERGHGADFAYDDAYTSRRDAAALPPALHRDERVSRLVDAMQRRTQAVANTLG